MNEKEEYVLTLIEFNPGITKDKLPSQYRKALRSLISVGIIKPIRGHFYTKEKYEKIRKGRRLSTGASK